MVGVIPGREIGGGILLLGAHYDSISIDPNDPTYYAPGANDNASGTSALIELGLILFLITSIVLALSKLLLLRLARGEGKKA